ncbi:hypothetical protein GCM10010472_61390 [Pseudonocardia halophobica]|uniref:Uncharacterized protein n=1 Tax=Pseudonocardia halophobica TaxID=29401 RepID=A0A9W6L6I3_9PSEU|nr:hypothetical protein [Pseudonocardia halophobica]GLL14183.1 hypothetical protein GCM10017577_53300 [Pseudonocardia halophobica]
MSDWFLAGEDEADAVASVASGEHSFDDWPHLSIPLRRSELAALYAALTEVGPADPRSPAGLLAVEVDAGMIVTRVPAAAIEALAEMTPRTAPPVMAAWSEAIAHDEPDALGEILSDLAAFARDAAESGRPVLELAPY